jgi:phosphatidylserine synthase
MDCKKCSPSQGGDAFGALSFKVIQPIYPGVFMFDSFTWSEVLALIFAFVYAISFVWRLCKLVWVKGARHEEVFPGEAVLIVFLDVWRVLCLPYVAFKAARAWKAGRAELDSVSRSAGITD